MDFRNRYRVLVGACLLLFIASSASPASASVKNPKVGDCYNYTNADIVPIVAVKASVPCSATHNQETYRVATWPASKNPHLMSGASRAKLAQSLCLPWKGKAKFFNTLNYYLPSRSAWEAGTHWLRCDAAAKSNTGTPSVWASWKGYAGGIR